jgi:3-isopropylmalate dehydratase small subunit
MRLKAVANLSNFARIYMRNAADLKLMKLRLAVHDISSFKRDAQISITVYWRKIF